MSYSKTKMDVSDARKKNAIFVTTFRKEDDAERCRKHLFDNIRWNVGPKPVVYYFKDDSWGDDYPLYQVIVRSRKQLSDYGYKNLLRKTMKALAESFKS